MYTWPNDESYATEYFTRRSLYSTYYFSCHQFHFYFWRECSSTKGTHMPTSRQSMKQHKEISPSRSIFWALAKPGNVLCCLKRNNLTKRSTVCHFSAQVSSVPGQHGFTHPTANLLLCSVANTWDNYSRRLSGLHHQPQRLAQNSPVLDITMLQKYCASPSHSTCNWFLILHITYFLQRGTITIQESLVDCNLVHWSPYFDSAQSSFQSK